MPPQTRYARCGELSIAYQVFGNGPSDVVVIPGFIWHIEQLWNDPGYHRMMRGIADFARVITYDKRGTGTSDPVAVAPTLDQRMDDVLAVMDAAGSSRATLFGVSEGGPIGALIAATHPERVVNLIIYGAFVCGLDRRDAPGGDKAAGLWRHIRTFADDHWGEGLNVQWGSPTVDSPAVRRTGGLMERITMSPAMARANNTANYSIDIRPILPSISVPTLVLHRKDDALPIEHGRYYADHIPGARMLELEGRDHWPFVGDVDAVVTQVEEFVTGTPTRHESRTLLATVLFTDIVSSTQHAAALGDSAWRALLEKHDEVVRRHLAEHGGREIKNLGDGFLAVFDRPARAVRCATDIITDAHGLSIEIRAGLHTGECEMRDDDIAGLAVHIGARIGALAGAGEVLVSRTVRDLVLGSGIEFVERGTHQLRGVPGDWQLFAVTRTAAQSPLEDEPRSTTAERAFLAASRRTPAFGRALNRFLRRQARPKG